jgi:cell division protein FtsL
VKREIRRILYTLASLVLVLAAAEVAMYNWRVSLSLEMLKLGETIESLRRERQELDAELAGLMSPHRLQQVGTSLGLEPLPLESFILMESGSGTGEGAGL